MSFVVMDREGGIELRGLTHTLSIPADVPAGETVTVTVQSKTYLKNSQ
ncbi:hypothetical protein ACGVWS_04415 [Enterobacteriaceae bacterium LUAb1]